MQNAMAYLRVSSKGQVDGFGFDRQEKAVQTFASANGYNLVQVFQEEGVSGKTEGEDRPAFKDMISAMRREGVNTIIIEGMDRLARELRVQENLCVYLAANGFDLISANTGENITQAMAQDPMKKALIQIQGVFAELDKSQTVRKLRKGLDKARLVNAEKGILTLQGKGKCEGRKSYKETNAALVKEAKRLYRVNPATGNRRSLRVVAQELFALGFATRYGKPFEAAQIKRLID